MLKRLPSWVTALSPLAALRKWMCGMAHRQKCWTRKASSCFPASTTRMCILWMAAIIEARILVTREQAFLTVDGQVGTPLGDDDVVVCKKSDFNVKLFKFAGRSFFDVLRTKLKWGER